MRTAQFDLLTGCPCPGYCVSLAFIQSSIDVNADGTRSRLVVNVSNVMPAIVVDIAGRFKRVGAARSRCGLDEYGAGIGLDNYIPGRPSGTSWAPVEKYGCKVTCSSSSS